MPSNAIPSATCWRSGDANASGFLDALDRLAAEPYAPHDFSFHSATAQREYQVKLAAGFTITYWLDHYANEVRVMHIARVGRG